MGGGDGGPQPGADSAAGALRAGAHAKQVRSDTHYFCHFLIVHGDTRLFIVGGGGRLVFVDLLFVASLSLAEFFLGRCLFMA